MLVTTLYLIQFSGTVKQWVAASLSCVIIDCLLTVPLFMSFIDQ